MNTRITVAAGLVAAIAASDWPSLYAGSASNPGAQVANGQRTAVTQAGRGAGGGSNGSGFATYSNLPSFGRAADALEINEPGTVIVGHARDSDDVLQAVKWTLENGSWTITILPRPPGSHEAMARGVNNLGDAAGHNVSLPPPSRTALLWPASGGFTVLGCAGDPAWLAGVYGISIGGQVAVGTVHYVDQNKNVVSTAGSVWVPGQCRQELPPLVAGGWSSARAVNGDGTLVGGTLVAGGAGVPVRWSLSGGQWLIAQLDTLSGGVRGANAAGDMAGGVEVPCGSENDCQRATIWYAGGGSRQLGTLGGDDSWAEDINSNGEVVGFSTSRSGNTAYFWSELTGMLELPFKGRWASAYALSDVRPDGTRVVVGRTSNGEPLVWVVRNP